MSVVEITLPALQDAQRQFAGDGKLNVQLLDQIVAMMNQGNAEERRQANCVLVQLKESPESWSKVDAILEFSAFPETKYFALQILESVIQTRWKALPPVQRDGIKTFIVQFILRLSETNDTASKNQLLLHKLNLVLVQIVKQEWPKNWPTFITDIVNSSKTSDSICINNMNILRLLSEEVFDFGSQHLTQAKEQHLKQQFCGQFQEVFTLCITILEKCPAPAMVEATLKTLHRFLSWIPVGYVFETNITQLLSENFLSLEMFRVVTLQCLTEIATINVNNHAEYEDKLRSMFFATVKEIGQLVGEGTDIPAAYKGGSDADQKFISCLAQFFVAFLKEHAPLVEPVQTKNGPAVNPELAKYHAFAIETLLQISQVEDVEVFKICLDYWCSLTAELYRLCPFAPAPSIGLNFGGGMADHPRRRLYRQHLSNLRTIMISRMAKPEEVLVVENDQGEVIRELVKDTDSINLYRNMRETLVYLTHLDAKDTENKMTQRLESQVTGTDFSWKNLNTLCWAVGSISGTITEEDEKRFLVLVIRDLLGLCEQKRGKDNKAVIASNIMYVVGQYPRFLRAHWKFLKTVINKLFEFMHETHEGVQDMACDTFIKIAIKCRRQFVIVQLGEQPAQPFIEEMLSSLSGIICDLSPPQVHVFYEAMGHIISAQTNLALQEPLIEKLMVLPNSVWDEVIQHAEGNVEVLKEPDVLRNLANILKTNVAACKSIGMPFMVQLSRIYMDTLNVYKILSENVSQAVAENGEEVLKYPVIKLMRTVKREILILLSTWVARSEDPKSVLENFVPPLFDAVLFDYQKNVAASREPKVLSLLSIIVCQLHDLISGEVPRILEAVFECTLNMINKDHETYPEHRTNFFALLLSLIQECFPVFLSMPKEQLQYILDAVVWAFQHSMRNVAEIGLDILKDMLSKVASLPEAQSQPFYKNFYMSILQHVLAVVADSSQVQVAGLTYYAEILCAIFRAAEFSIKVPLNDANPAQSNIDFIYEYIGEIFVRHFQNLTQDQIRVTIKGFFSFNTDMTAMRNHLRDFLVQIKEFNGEDTGDLFLEEREAEIQAAQAKKKAIPGMVNPHELEEDDMR